MRALALFLIVVAIAGCRSRDGRRYDYLRTNRDSLDYLKETERDNRRMRRINLKRDVDFGPRLHDNRLQRKWGREYGWTSLWKDMDKRGLKAWGWFKEEVAWDGQKIRHSALFGHLDSGDP